MKNIIEVTNLTTSYKDRIIQDNISFSVKHSEIFGILGGSGSGKSTLLNTMIYLKEPLSGCIKIFDSDIWKINQNKRSVILRKCGVVFQFGALYSSLSVLDNVGIMLEEYSSYPKKIIDEISQYFIDIVGLPNYVKNMYPYELSGGMKKRVGLARALAFNPKILFLDEPTSGLDPQSAEKFDRLILNLRDHFNLSVVMVTHDLDSIKDITDRFILLDKSKILFYGNLEEFKYSEANKIDNLLKSKRGERLWREE